jgi:tetratricopeptide (TPR) repeat protein
MDNYLQLLLHKARQSGDDDEAIRIYERILKHVPTNDEAHYNLGLVYKHQQNWEKSFFHNQESARLDPTFEPAWWNLGTAATMLKKWRVARQAWNHFGCKYADSDAEITGQIGITPIRLDPKGLAEVIWCKRIDPARTVIENVPTVGSGRHYGDILLNDGAPHGYRTVNKQEYPVFDEITVIQKSEYLSFEIAAEGSKESELQEFERICEGYNVEFENWTETLRAVCKACSEGRPHAHHDTKIKPPKGVYRFGLAAKTHQQVEQILESWMLMTHNKRIKIVSFG